ncbi:MAG: hypothetical protein JSS61_02535 [Verrucomicrobia bacterium]|nr:hypothetical protein [Verrucomicrobiota bacterium]
MKLPNLSPPLLWLLLLLAPIPFLYSFFHFFSAMHDLEEIEEQIERLSTRKQHLEQIQRAESALLASLKQFHPQYIDNELENLTFLLPEVKKLETLYLDHPGDEQIARRLASLKANRLQFTEDQIRTSELFREIEESQQQPIEVNEEDLKKILCLIEGITIWPYGPKEGRPHLLIKDFKLTKKELPSKEKVFLLSMRLIKREQVR